MTNAPVILYKLLKIIYTINDRIVLISNGLIDGLLYRNPSLSTIFPISVVGIIIDGSVL